MAGMFNECSNLKKLDVSKFNTENVSKCFKKYVL